MDEAVNRQAGLKRMTHIGTSRRTYLVEGRIVSDERDLLWRDEPGPGASPPCLASTSIRPSRMVAPKNRCACTMFQGGKAIARSHVGKLAERHQDSASSSSPLRWRRSGPPISNACSVTT